MFIENDSFTVYGAEFLYCEYPKAEMVLQRIPNAFPNVSAVSGYSIADKAALDEIAKEMGDEISALYESAASEEMPFWEDADIAPVYVLAGMAGEIADKVRAENAAKIAAIVESPLHQLGLDIVAAFGNRKNVLTRMHDSKNIELYAVESNLKKGIDEVDIIGLIRPADNGIVFNAALSENHNARFTRDIPFESLELFVSAFDSIIPNRVNKMRDDSFRNGKGARTKGSELGIANKTADKAIVEIVRDEDKAVIEEAMKFGYFPLPNYQGKDDISEEDKKARATMKKRNQRAKKKAMETMDAKRLEIMEMIDAISERQIDLKPRAKANSDKAIVPAETRDKVLATLKGRNQKARETAEIFDHKKMAAELDKRLSEYARKAIAKRKAAK